MNMLNKNKNKINMFKCVLELWNLIISRNEVFYAFPLNIITKK